MGHGTRELERALIERILAGETEAFGSLISEHEKSLYRAAWKYLRDSNDVEDVVQDAVLKALQALPRFRGDSAFGTWIVQITLNEARMRLRTNRAHLFQCLDPLHPFDESGKRHSEVSDNRETAERRMLRMELEGRFEEVIWGLPEAYRTVVVLKDICCVSLEKIAETTGSSIGAVRTRLCRARAKLRNALIPRDKSGARFDRSLHPSLENVPVECARVLTALYEMLDHELGMELLRDAEKHFKKCPRCSAVVRGANTLVSLFCGLREFTLVGRLKADIRTALSVLIQRPTPVK
ncbi:MAG: sigma-70 family RNA polymerase sigma factor [Acidobacteriaceae bacterium]